MSVISMAARRRARDSAAGSGDAGTDSPPWHMYQRSLVDDLANRRVVVGVDGSCDSGAALRQAASQARQRNATLDVVYVISADADDSAAVAARVMLGEFTRRECPGGIGAPVCLRIERGDPAQALLRASDGAELLVVGW
jgi:nucleotide-binding universal stress UspA family protein